MSDRVSVGRTRWVTHMVLYGTSMFSPFKTCVAFFPLPYFLYTPLTLMAKSDPISDPIHTLVSGVGMMKQIREFPDNASCST